MRQPKQFLIEGIDRLGKTTLIEELQQRLGYHLVVHYERPRKLHYYEEISRICSKFGSGPPLEMYQRDVYKNMFRIIDSGTKVIFDRAHLGEMVYAPMYRKYDGSYVLDFEKDVKTLNARLVLLTTSDFSFLKDDGLSIDFSKKEEEQGLFIDAFYRSGIEDKVVVDVSNGNGGYRPLGEILTAVLRN